MIRESGGLTGRFRSPDVAQAFTASYQAALDRWPAGTSAVDVTGPYGTTHVQVCGPPDGAPLVLLHGGGGTSASWFANAGPLSQVHRVYALDQIDDAGLSVPADGTAGGQAGGQTVRRPRDLMGWLDGVLDQLGLDAAAFAGHSYGAWLALSYALHAPRRVTGLALLDPTTCFAGLRPGYLLRAVPLFIRPTQARARAVVTWETAQASLPPDALLTELATLGGGEFRRPGLVRPRRPAAADLAASRVPMLVLLAEHSRAHDIQRVGQNAERLAPGVTPAVLPGAALHTLPATSPDELNQRLLDFLGGQLP
jgi:pimeloyl-ACP methyl ester carboxylesterase